MREILLYLVAPLALMAAALWRAPVFRKGPAVEPDPDDPLGGWDGY